MTDIVSDQIYTAKNVSYHNGLSGLMKLIAIELLWKLNPNKLH